MLSTPPLTMTTRSGLITGKKRNLPSPVKKEREDNNNQTPLKMSRKNLARTPTKLQTNITSKEDAEIFSKWLQDMLDNDRHNLILYLADEVILEWFGRTIRTRKKVSGFLQFEMQASRHHFVNIIGCPPFVARVEMMKRPIAESPKSIELATPLNAAETPATKLRSSLNRLTVRGSSLKKRAGLRSDSVSPEKRPLSPEWDTNALKHGLDVDMSSSEKKRMKRENVESTDDSEMQEHGSDSGHGKSERKSRISFCRKLQFDNAIDEGIGVAIDESKKVNTFVTPVKRVRGPGDCFPSTSDESKARSILVANLPRKYVECNGFVEFARSKGKRCADAMTWERKCKVQVCYTEDPVNVGEYTIWTIVYSDDIKCKRNLLAAFEEVARAESAKKKLF